MNKKTLIALFIGLAVIILIIFGLKSCNPRQKIITSEAEEYSAFINANIEFTCEVIKNPALAQNSTESQEKLNGIYSKYKLPVENNDSMLKILEKYENNAEVASIIQQNTTDCIQGGSPIFYQGE